MNSGWACASGSSERVNNNRLRGQPCLDPLKMAKGGITFPASTTAVGFFYNTLIMSIKGIPNPMDLSTDHKKGYSRWSKAFIASIERTATGEFRP